MNRSRTVRSPQDLGLLIAQARKLRGLSQRQLAADFGASQAWISRVEQGHQKTWIAQVFRLAVYLGIEMTAQVRGTVAVKTEHQAKDDYPNLDDLI